MKKNYIGIMLIIALLFIVGCTSESENTTQRPDTVDFESSSKDWRTFKLTDIRGDSFTISQQSQKPVLVETFAIWCSNCKRQQQIVSDLHDSLGDSFESISIEIDPNAKVEALEAYANNNNFDSRYVVAPQTFTQSLVDEFGAQIVSAPSVPMLFICGDEVTQLRRGIKDAEELTQLIEGCNV